MKTVTIATALLFALIYLLPLGQRPLVVPDEVRYSEIPREMISSGNWIVPHLDGVRYFEKPAVGYWAIAASMLVFGENAFAARLPSALSVGVSAILIGLLMRRAGLGKTAAGLAPAAFLTSLGVFAAGVFNVLDGMFSALVTATIVSFYYAYQEPDRRRRTLFLAGAGAACGLAFLVKGLAGPTIVAIVILPFLAWERRGRDLLRIAWLPIVVAVLVSLPWSIAIALREHDFWHRFVWVEHFQRFMGSGDEQHPRPFWYLVPFLLVGTLPWNLFLAAITHGIRRIGLQGSFLRLLICWFVFPFVFLSLSRGKLPTYVIPCYPPLAILMAAGLVTYLESGKVRLFTIGAALAAAIAGLGAVFLIVSFRTRWFDLAIFGPTEGWKCALAVVGLAAWVLVLMPAIKARDHRRKLAWYCAAPILTLLLMPRFFPVEPHAKMMPGPFLQQYADRIDPAALLVSDRALVHAVCWFYRRDDVFLLAFRAGELEYGLSYKDSSDRLLDLSGFLNLLGNRSGQRRVIVILSTDVHDMCVRNAAGRLPPTRFEATQDGLWIGEY